MSEDDKDVVDKPLTVVSAGSGSNNAFPLVEETVWLRQHFYEHAEMLYHTTVATQLPAKGSQAKQDLEAQWDLLDKRLQAQVSSLLATAKSMWARLEDIEKGHNDQAQVTREMATRLALAVEEYQTRMSLELVSEATQLNLFRSLLTEVESVVDRTRHNLAKEKWGSFKTHEGYSQAVIGRLSNLGQGLESCMAVYNSCQAEVSKLDIGRIVGEISKVSLCKRTETDEFLERKDGVSNEIKLLLRDTAGVHGSDSDTSLEGNCSGCSDDSDNESSRGFQKNRKSVSQSKKIIEDNKQPDIRSNRNNANNVSVGNRSEKLKAKTDFPRPQIGQYAQAMPIKRNVHGAQSVTYKKPDLFQFRGVSNPSPRVPFVNQLGLLGPRPNNSLLMQAANQQGPFRFSNLSPAVRQQIPNSGATHNMNPLSALGQPRFGNMNFNFSSSRASPFDIGRGNIGQNSLLASMGMHSPSTQGNHAAANINSQIAKSKLLQIQQNQSKVAKGSDQLFGAKSGAFYPLQQNPRAPLFLQNSRAGLMGSSPLAGVSHDSIEQQLNEMAYKIQQMQLAASQNVHLQHLMRETERLKQLVTHKQHQQQDQVKHQFQLLINAFLQQQQMQGPQSKMARSIHFFNTQKQQQRNILYNRQLHSKKVKPESPVKPLPPGDESLLKRSLSGQSEEGGLQNGDDDLSQARDDRKMISQNCQVARIGTFSPHAHGDKHRAGVSSVVVMEDISCVVVVDIINSCLKLYSVTITSGSPTELSHHQVTCLELSRPYYMSKLNQDTIVVSREGRLLSLVRVSKNRLECLSDLKTETQYYGLGYVSDNVIVCAAFADGKIDLLNVRDSVTQTVTLLTECKGPELVAAVPSTGCILYLGRVVNETVHLLGISQTGSIDFSVDLESSPTDVWSIASISDRIICCSKESGKVKLFNQNGQFVTDVNFPPRSVNQPFAMAFCNSGNMYIANDGAWDKEFEHYVTTDINVYSFS